MTLYTRSLNTRTKTKKDVQVDVLNHLNDIRKQYKLPPAFTSWDTVPPSVLKQRIEKQLAETNISSQTFIGFHIVDEPTQHRVKISYSVNNASRKHVRIRYAKHGGIDHIKDKMSQEMNKIREGHGLHRVNYTWHGLEFNEIEH